MNRTRRKDRGEESGGGHAPLPFDSTSTEAKLRSLPMTLAIIVVVALIVWIRLGR